MDKLCSCGKLYDVLNFSRSQTHLWHLQTSSYSVHKALDNYYSTLTDLMDDLIESFMGTYNVNVITKESFVIENLKDENQMLSHFDTVLKELSKVRETLDSTALQNAIDEILGLIGKTRYLLSLQ